MINWGPSRIMEKKKSITAVIIIFDVLSGSERIGTGYCYEFPDGSFSEPILTYDNGEKMPEGWFNLLAKSQHIVQIPMNGRVH